MPIRPFISSLTSTSTTRRPTRCSAAPARLSLELLEDRRVLSFGPLVGRPYGSPFQPGVMMAADFNGDGQPDFAVGGIGVLLGTGDGTFQSILPSGTSDRPFLGVDTAILHVI